MSETNERTPDHYAFVDVQTVKRNQSRNRMDEPPILLKDNETGEIIECHELQVFDKDGNMVARFMYDLYNPVNKGKYGKATVWFESFNSLTFKPISKNNNT